MPFVGPPCISTPTSATAPLRSSVPYTRRPRSRLGNPAWLRRSGGRHRFRRSSSPPVQARHSTPRPSRFRLRLRSSMPGERAIKIIYHIHRRQPARLRSSPIQITPLSVVNPTKCKEAATAPEASGGGRCRCGATNYNAKLPAVASAITSSYVM